MSNHLTEGKFMSDQQSTRLLAEQVAAYAQPQGASGQIDVSGLLQSGSPDDARAQNKLTGGAAGRSDNGGLVQHGAELPHLQPKFGQDEEPMSHIGGHMQLDLTSNPGDDADV